MLWLEIYPLACHSLVLFLIFYEFPYFAMSIQIHAPQHEFVVHRVTIPITPAHNGDADPITYDIKNTGQQQFHERMLPLITWYRNAQMPVTATNMNNMLMLYSPEMSDLQLGHMCYFFLLLRFLEISFTDVSSNLLFTALERMWLAPTLNNASRVITLLPMSAMMLNHSSGAVTSA